MSTETERVELETPDLAAEKRAAFEELFPGVLADGVLDGTRLAELLDTPVTAPADGRERFGLMWAGKQDAVKSLLAPSRAALIPESEKSEGFDDAEHVFIEGDNLEVLKLLQKAYNDRVKLIYIDPPYNTGNDFVYADDFGDTLKAYLEYTGQIDGDGNRVAAAVDAAGRRHSAWLRMMYPRLVLARNLLTQDGAIFVSIDDNEGANLRLLMDEVFGPENFLACVVWNHTKQSRNNEPYFSRQHNLILVYRRSEALKGFQMARREEHNKAYSNPDNDPRGPWRSGDVRNPAPRPTLRYVIRTPSGNEIAPPPNGWRWSEEAVQRKIATGEIVFSADETRIVRKIYLADQGGRTPENIWDTSDVGGTREATGEIKEIFGSQVFDTPKPVRLIRRILELGTSGDGDDIVLDFFAGSGSTAAAVLQANAEDGGSRRFVLVNLPERTAPGSEAANSGFERVSDITHARIEAALDEAGQTGLRTYRLDASNFHDVTSTEPSDLFDLRETTLRVGGAESDAVAAEVLLKEGVPLDAPWERREVGGAPVIIAAGVAVVLSADLTEDVVDDALALAPRVLVLLEDGFAGADAVKANAVTNAKNVGVTLKTV